MLKLNCPKLKSIYVEMNPIEDIYLIIQNVDIIEQKYLVVRWVKTINIILICKFDNQQKYYDHCFCRLI